MELTDEVISDMRYLRNRFGWNEDDARDVMQAIREGGAEIVRYFTVLAAAYRAGYEQNEENEFVRLQAWCIQKGLGDPFSKEFDIAALNALAVEVL
jgi:hypothetical protein